MPTLNILRSTVSSAAPRSVHSLCPTCTHQEQRDPCFTVITCKNSKPVRSLPRWQTSTSTPPMTIGSFANGLTGSPNRNGNSAPSRLAGTATPSTPKPENPVTGVHSNQTIRLLTQTEENLASTNIPLAMKLYPFSWTSIAQPGRRSPVATASPSLP